MMHVTVHADAAHAAADVATRLQTLIATQPNVVLGLPTGRTPIPVYARLVDAVQAGALSLRDVTTFNLDEYLGLGAEAPGSFQRFMRDQLFDHTDGGARLARHFLDGLTHDADAESVRFEDAIVTAGGMELAFLGIGRNGHIGFNEPGPSLHARTHVVTLTHDTRRANAPDFGGDAERVPARAITMGVGTMMSARQILILATGEAKAEAVRAMVEGDVTTQVPASLLQLHRTVHVVLDAPAASALTRR